MRIPMIQAGMVTMMIWMLLTLKPLSAEMDAKATTAAAMGEQVIPICEAMEAMPQGHSGRMPFFRAMSQMIGIRV